MGFIWMSNKVTLVIYAKKKGLDQIIPEIIHNWNCPMQVLRRLQMSPRVYFVGRSDAPDNLGIVPWLGKSLTDIHWNSIKLLDQVDQPQNAAETVICISAGRSK